MANLQFLANDPTVPNHVDYVIDSFVASICTRPVQTILARSVDSSAEEIIRMLDFHAGMVSGMMPHDY